MTDLLDEVARRQRKQLVRAASSDTMLAMTPAAEEHEVRTNGWCFCDRCNEAREDLSRYDDDDTQEAES